MFKHQTLHLAAMFFLVLFLPGLAAPTATAAEKSDAIRVGVIQMKGYGDTDNNGNLSGVNVEYAYKIAQYANLNIRVILFKDGKDALDQLNAGKIDAMCNVIKTPEREKQYLFSARELGSLPMCVFTGKRDTRYAYRNLQQLKDMTFGAESVSKVRDYFFSWCTQHGIRPAIKLYDNLDEIKAAVKSGEVDAGIYGAPSVAGFRTIQTFSPVPYYLIFQKCSTWLKNRADGAMETILTEDPLYFDKLVRKYTSSIQYEMESLTEKEQSYLRAHPTLNVAVLKNDLPYFSSSDQSASSGILPDFYKRISALTGAEFKFRTYDNQQAAIAAVADGKADILGIYSNGQISANHLGLRLTRACANVDAVLIAHSGASMREIKTIAIQSRSKASIQSSIGSLHGVSYAEYDNVSACFQALKRGQADAVICGLPSATWLINQSLASAYTIQTMTSGSLEICSATAYANNVLCSVLNKAVNVSAFSFNEIVTNDTLPGDSLETMISRLPPVRTAIAAAILLALVLGLILALIALQRRHCERTALLAKAAAHQRRENELAAMARVTESKNQFFSNISHDMRTPLNAMIGFSRLAQEKPISPEVRRDLEKIQSSGNLLLELINDTLISSKAASGKLVLHQDPVSGQELFNSVVTPIQESARQKEIVFAADNSEAVPRWFLADKLSLQKIMLNLLSNAVKYTPSGGHVSFTVRDEKNTAGTLDTVILVRDNGIGMSENFLKHLYEPFVQEERAGYETRGTGLGLSIVKQLVDLMSGSIAVRSRQGVGTEFTLRLHFEDAAPPQEPALKQEPPASSGDLKNRKILLCEDNRLNSEIARAFLGSAGISVVTAENGRIGVQLLSDSKPNEFFAALMDIRMPVMDGYEATRRIRALPRADVRSIPIIAMTADALEEDLQRGMDAGMDSYLSKPLDPKKLLELLHRCAHPRRAGGSKE